jgi:hypothetical protein
MLLLILICIYIYSTEGGVSASIVSCMVGVAYVRYCQLYGGCGLREVLSVVWWVGLM